MSDYSEAFTTQDATHEIWAQELSVVAAQFVEAACRARNGDPEATRAHVAHALSLLKGLPSLGPSGTHLFPNRDERVIRGGLPAWQGRRISAHVEANISARIHIKQRAPLVGLSASHFC